MSLEKTTYFKASKIYFRFFRTNYAGIISKKWVAISAILALLKQEKMVKFVHKGSRINCNFLNTQDFTKTISKRLIWDVVPMQNSLRGNLPVPLNVCAIPLQGGRANAPFPSFRSNCLPVTSYFNHRRIERKCAQTREKYNRN